MGGRRRRFAAEARGRHLVPATLVCFAIWMACGQASTARANETNLTVRGLIDLVARANEDELLYNTNNMGDSNFDNVRSRLFVEGGTERTHGFVQILLSDVGPARIRLYGAYLTHQLFEAKNVFLEAGKIPSHDGIWAPHTYSHKNPLVGTPLAYYYKSSLPSKQMPTGLDQLVGQRGQGQSGVAYEDTNGPRGAPAASMPILYDNCWDYGAFVIGSTTRYDYAIGLTVGAPGAPIAGPDTNGRPSWHARLGFAPAPGLRLHATAARGSYLAETVEPFLPAGSGTGDYAQMLWIASLEWDYGHAELKSEGFLNHFETPLREDGLASQSYYATVKYKFFPGWYAALRFDALRFEKVETTAGTVTWDDDVRRAEMGFGYHVTHELLVKLVGQITDAGHGWRHILPATQFSYRF